MAIESHARLRVQSLIIKTVDAIEYRWRRSRMLRVTTSLRREVNRKFPFSPTSVLLIRLASIGDVVRSTALVRVLRRRYPTSHIDYLTSSLVRPVLEGNPHIDDVFTLEGLDSLPRYDWVITFNPPILRPLFYRKSGIGPTLMYSVSFQI